MTQPDPEWSFSASITLPDGVRFSADAYVPESIAHEDVIETMENVSSTVSRVAAAWQKATTAQRDAWQRAATTQREAQHAELIRRANEMRRS